MGTFINFAFYSFLGLNFIFVIINCYLSRKSKKSEPSISLKIAFSNISEIISNLYKKCYILPLTFLFAILNIIYINHWAKDLFEHAFFLISKIPSQTLGTIIGILLTFFSTITVNYYFNNLKNKYLVKSAARLIKEDLNHIILEAFYVRESQNTPSYKLTFLKNWGGLLQQMSNVLSDNHIKRIYEIYTRAEKHNKFLDIKDEKSIITRGIIFDRSINDNFLVNQQGDYENLSFSDLNLDLEKIAKTGNLRFFSFKKICHSIRYIHYRKKYFQKIENFTITYLKEEQPKNIAIKNLEKVFKESEQYKDLFTSKLKYPFLFLVDVFIASEKLEVTGDKVSLKKNP